MTPTHIRFRRACVAAAAAGLLVAPAVAGSAYGTPAPVRSAPAAPTPDADGGFPELTPPSRPNSTPPCSRSCARRRCRA